MKYKNIYDLSKLFSPPKVDLRQAKIMDSYGDESLVQHLIDHKKPEDVAREDLEYYKNAFPFVEMEDLLFYLYSVIVEFKNDKELSCFDSYLYNLDYNIEDIQKQLSDDQNAVLKKALMLAWMTGNEEWADWEGCQNLQDFMGL